MPASPFGAWLRNFGREVVAAAFKGSFAIPKVVTLFFTVAVAIWGQEVRGRVVWDTEIGVARVTDTQFVFGLLIVLWVVACAGYAAARALPSRIAFAGVINGDAALGWTDHCRVRVVNLSSRKVCECGVALVRSDPSLPNLPLPLHCMHETRPDSRCVDMVPGDERVFDVAAKPPDQAKFVFKGAAFEPDHPAQEYRITLRLTAADSAPTDRDFIVKPGPTGPVIEEADPA